MDINLTKSGVMMNNGLAISTDVSVDVIRDGSVRISYTDENNTSRTDIRDASDNSYIFMKNSRGIINSVLSKNDDYLIIWEPK